MGVEGEALYDYFTARAMRKRIEDLCVVEEAAPEAAVAS
jgi:hypothetical protein